jgi:hypothetical protein
MDFPYLIAAGCGQLSSKRDEVGNASYVKVMFLISGFYTPNIRS